MKRICLIALLVLSTASFAQDKNRRDGNWWLSLEQVDKTNYMVGFFDGAELGRNFSYCGFSGTAKANCLGYTMKSFNDYEEKYFSNVTNGQVADGLDAFYKDYKNRSIKVSNAVWLVLSSIAGTPQKELDKKIENVRAHASKD